MASMLVFLFWLAAALGNALIAGSVCHLLYNKRRFFEAVMVACWASWVILHTLNKL